MKFAFRKKVRPAWEGLDLTQEDVDDFMAVAATSGREQVPLAIAAQIASEINGKLAAATEIDALGLARCQGGLMALHDFCAAYRRGLENARQHVGGRKPVSAGGRVR